MKLPSAGREGKAEKIFSGFYLWAFILFFSPSFTFSSDVWSFPKPSLIEVVFFGLRSPEDLCLDEYSEKGKACIQTYLAALPPHSKLREKIFSVDAQEILSFRRRNLENQILLLLGPKAAREARAFSAVLPLSLEWEGISEGPLQEADFADRWLVLKPATPLAPFLYLFMAHRVRAACEAAQREQKKEALPVLTNRYQEMMEKAKSAKIKLISCLAFLLEEEPYVYLEGQGPRFYYPRFRLQFEGQVSKGKRFVRSFGSRFIWILEPRPGGWEILIKEKGREENLARLTTPLHFGPNPREIEGWQMLDDPSACPSRPYRVEEPLEKERSFFFSPEVGRGIGGEKAGKSVTPEDIEAVRSFGQGLFKIETFILGKAINGCPEIESMTFSVHLTGGY
jgi:hypothetical protein